MNDVADIEEVPIESIMPHPANARRGNVEAIMRSITETGFHGVVVCQASTRRILVGKHRWEALKALGKTTVTVNWRDVNDVDALKIIVNDNRASDMASYDDAQLLTNLRNMENGQGTLFDSEAIDSLAIRVEGVPLIADHEFKGDYADSGLEDQNRSIVAERVGREMKDVVLALEPAQYAEFIGDVKLLQKRWALSGVITTVVKAVHDVAQDTSVAAASEGKLTSMRELLRTLEWAIPHKDHEKYLETIA